MARTILLDGEPNPKQDLFFRADAPHIAYGGARGGGKSWAMRRKFVLLALNYAGLKLLLLRRTFAELEGNHILPLLKELNGFAKYSSEKKLFTFPNGSIIRLGYCDTDKDVWQYQGQEYEVIGFEEATQFTEYQLKFISTCNRTTRSDFTPRIYYTCNPGGVGHSYIKRLFIDKAYEPDERPEDYVFIQAFAWDNKVLMENDPGYIQHLKTLPPHLRKAYLDGDWYAIEGQYFEEFNIATHVVQPFEIPLWWRRFRAMDWGFNDPTCVLWFAVSPDRRVYVYREIKHDKDTVMFIIPYDPALDGGNQYWERSINGHILRLQRGKQYSMPRYIVDFIESRVNLQRLADESVSKFSSGAGIHLNF